MHFKTIKAAALVAAIAVVTAPTQAFAEKTLRAGIWLPLQTVWAQPTVMFVDRVNETGAGVIQINLVGPEAIPGGEIANAVRTGLLDVATLPPGLYKQQVPLGNAQDISNMSVAEQKESGGYDLVRAMLKEQLGVHLLATYGDGIPFHIFLSDEIQSIDDLKGKRLRSSAIYNSFFTELGIIPTNIAAPETYTSLERGVVDGLGWPRWGVQDLGWHEFLKTRIDPGYYNVAINVMANNVAWDGLSEEERKIIEEAVTWLEGELPAFYEEKNAENYAIQEEAGIVSFDAGPVLPRLAEDIYWEEMATIDAEQTGKLRNLLQK